MRKILSVTAWRDLPDYDCLDLFEGVTAPIVQWWRKDAPEHGWREGYGIAEFRTERDAERAGVAAGFACLETGLNSWCVGAWQRWAGIEGRVIVPDPYTNMQVFVDAFRVAAPSGVTLSYKGIAAPHTGMSTGYRKLHDAALIAQFDRMYVTNFGTDPEKVYDAFHARTFRYDKWTECVPEFGVGRIDRKGDLWGDWRTTCRLLLDTKPSTVSFSFTKGARLQMRVGHPYHPPLVQCVKEF